MAMVVSSIRENLSDFSINPFENIGEYFIIVAIIHGDDRIQNFSR